MDYVEKEVGMFYVKEFCTRAVVDYLTNVADAELVCCEMTDTKSSLVICLCYHSTSSSMIAIPAGT